MNYKVTWKGNVDREDGIAVFDIDGVEESIRLDSFRDYFNLTNMIDTIFLSGKTVGANLVSAYVTKGLEEFNKMHSI